MSRKKPDFHIPASHLWGWGAAGAVLLSGLLLWLPSHPPGV